MRIIIAGALLLVSTLLVAAEEKEIWACQGVDGNGFIWKSGKLLICIQN